MSSKISVRQAFVPKLTFIGVDYRDYYYIDAPGDGTLVKISMNPSVLSPLHILPVFLALLKYHIGCMMPKPMPTLLTLPPLQAPSVILP